jgi:hypothetical protein
MQVKPARTMYLSLLVVSALLLTGNAGGAQKEASASAPPPPQTGKALIIVYRHGSSRGGKGYPIIFINRNFLTKLRYATYATLEVPQGPVVLDATFEQMDRGTTFARDEPGLQIPVGYFPFTSLIFDSGCVAVDWWHLGRAQRADLDRCDGELRDANAAANQVMTALYGAISPQPGFRKVLKRNAAEIFLTAHPDLKERLRICGPLISPNDARLCQIEVSQAAATLNPRGHRIELEGEVGKTYYIKYDVPTFSQSTMALVDAATGAKEISRLKAATD